MRIQLRRAWLLLVLACTLLSCTPLTATTPTAKAPIATVPSATVPTAAPAYPFPQHVTYAPGTIRPNHRSQAQLDEDVRNLYLGWKHNYLVKVAGDPPRYRIQTMPNRTVSEGQGYGMVIVAIMAGEDKNAREIFDGLWLFAHDHPSKIDRRLMAWTIPEQAGGENSAFDGDADIAYGLLLADAQWGSTGIINYKAEALILITAILESTIGPQSRLPMLGDWATADGDLYNQYTPRSSDLMAGHFRAFARATDDTAWSSVISSTQQMITIMQSKYGSATGLLPDFIQTLSASDHSPRPADPTFLEGPDDGHYYYNAGRAPWRIGTDALLNNDPVSIAQARRLADWVAAASTQNSDNIRAGYTLDGAPLPNSTYFTSFFVTPFGVALMTQPKQQPFLNDLYDAIFQRSESYYPDSVTLLSLLVITGNFWDPTLVTPTP